MVTKILATAGGSLLVFGMFASAGQADDAKPFDATHYYSSKCVACHGKKAEKKFDTSHADDQLVDAVLKGKKGEKPPNMPGYGAKGLTAEQAKALVDHMKQLKSTP
jgi:mono/diheme cytochrome c family protein